MQPTMMAKPSRSASRRHRQRLGQPAGLVELDVDGIVFAGERGKRRAVVHALVGAHRDRPRDRRKRGIVAGRQRLLDQRDARRSAGGEICREVVRRARPRWHRRSVRRSARPRAPRECAPDRPRRRASPSAACARQPCAAASRHRLGRAERDRVGGDERTRRRQARQAHAPACRSLWPRNPRRRSRARCARRPPASRPAAPAGSSPSASRTAHRLDGRRDARDRLAIARIGHALAAARCTPVADLRDHDLGFASWRRARS